MTGLDQPAGLECPACGALPAAVFGGGTQAFCSNEDCRVLTWDPTKTLAQLMAGIHQIRIDTDP